VIESANGRVMASRTFSAGPAWRTETLSFKLDEPAMKARAFALKLAGAGVLNVDAFQAWQGLSERAYRSQGECEVALAIPKSEFSETRLQFADEPARFEYCVTGQLDGATLKFTAATATGREAVLPEVKLGRAGLGRLLGREKPGRENGACALTAFPDAPLGQFRITAWVERDGVRVSPVNELLLTRIRRPVHLREDAPNSPFGAHFMASPLTIKMLKAAGVNWARFHDAATELTGWYHLEPEKGKWAFRDQEIQLYRDHHIKIFAGLQTTPLWASYYQDAGKPDVHGYFDRYFPPKRLDDWSRYVQTVTARYRGVIDDYFIWNEPWGATFWHTGYNAATKDYTQAASAAADFAKLSIATYQAAKAGNPAAQISGFNSYGDDKGQAWTRGVFDAGAYPYCDLVDYHFYTDKDQAQPGDQAQAAYDAAIGYLKQAVPGFAKPVYLSEGQSNSNGVTGSGVGLYQNAICWAADRQPPPAISADKTCRYVVASLAAGAAKVFLYSAHCYACLAVEATYVAFVAVIGPDGYPNVETAAYSNLAWFLEDATFVRVIKLNAQVNGYLFTGRQGMVAVISGLRNGVYQVPPSAELAVSDLFGNPSDGIYRGTLLYVATKLSAPELEKRLGANRERK
ncbi:MAG: hypothetical protein WCH61_08485, partial [bacterium]